MRPYKGLWGLLFILANGFACAAAETGSPPAEYWDVVREVVERTNEERASFGLPPLKLNSDLCRAARWMAADMANHGYIGHKDSEGRRLARRVPEFQYDSPYWLGENIAAGQRTPERVVLAWMASPSHRQNMLHHAYREIGVGHVFLEGSRYGHYWALEFGSRSDYFPVVINLEAVSTDSPEVDLYIYGEGWAEQMRLSSDGLHWTEWQPFRARIKWRVPSGNGFRTVFVQLRKGNQVLGAHDEIMLVGDR